MDPVFGWSDVRALQAMIAERAVACYRTEGCCLLLWQRGLCSEARGWTPLASTSGHTLSDVRQASSLWEPVVLLPVKPFVITLYAAVWVTVCSVPA